MEAVKQQHTLCEFGNCQRRAKVEAVMTNLKTKESQKAKVCKDHLPTLIDSAREQGRLTNFTGI